MNSLTNGVGSEFLYIVYAMWSASAYVGAAVVMKQYQQLGLSKAGALIALFLVAAVFFETVALMTQRFGMILLLILGCECVVGLTFSWLWLKESYTLTELVGFGLIITGVGLVKVGPVGNFM